MFIVDQVGKMELLLPRASRFQIFVFCGVNREGPDTAKVLILDRICISLETVSKKLYKYNA